MCGGAGRLFRRGGVAVVDLVDDLLPVLGEVEADRLHRLRGNSEQAAHEAHVRKAARPMAGAALWQQGRALQRAKRAHGLRGAPCAELGDYFNPDQGWQLCAQKSHPLHLQNGQWYAGLLHQPSHDVYV